MMAQLSRVILRRLKSLVTQPVATVEFPYVVRHAAQGARVSLRNNFSECIGCHRCEAACPTQCIQLTSEAYSSKEKAPKTSKGVVFEEFALKPAPREASATKNILYFRGRKINIWLLI